jgi:hypothetical protein
MVTMAVAVPPAINPTGFALNDDEIPGYEEAAVRLTLQQNPLRLVTLIVPVEKEPSCTVRLVGLALMVKSTTWIGTVMKCVREPLVPVTVTK